MASQRDLVEHLFEAALALQPTERDAFLNEECKTDPELRRLVEELLADDARAGSFLQHPPLDSLDRSIASGTQLGQYEILSPLGAGGMGEVYRARDSRLGRDVAIKVLASFLSLDPERIRRFDQEARAAAALNHPNILAVFQMGTHRGAPYLVSELLEGNTLRHLVQHGPLQVGEVLDYGIQIARGLAAAHEKGIAHRDLKPENLFVTKDGRVKILDFGLAKLIRRRPRVDDGAASLTEETEPGMVMGTVGYMSPEQARGEEADHRSDIFAFGAILYEMLTGCRAFQGATPADRMSAILKDEPPEISQKAPTVPAGLKRVVYRCLKKATEQRFQSASDLAFALEALSESGNSPIAATAPRSRSRWIWAAAASLAIAMIAALILWWRVPPAVPVVKSVVQLTDDGRPKKNMVSDGSRIYFQQVEPSSIGQVSVTGGATAPVETKFTQSLLNGITQDGSALLVDGTNSPVTAGFLPMNSGALWLIPIPAGEPRRLGNIDALAADIFPDGRIIFAKFSSDTTQWFVAEKDGSNARELVSLPGVEGSVSISPDGQRIILTQEVTGDRRLFELAADGSGRREIRRLREDEQNFRWTTDGKYLLYQAGTAPRSDIWLLPMQRGILRRNGNPIRLTNGPLPYTFPCPSRDGKQIFALGAKQRGELVRYDMKSKQFVPFLSGISATDPTFSRDGRWVAYASYPDHILWRSRSDGNDRMQLTYAPLQVYFPFISPDGRKVAFQTDKNEVFWISMEGGAPQRILDGAANAAWSPDGNYLYAYQVDIDARKGGHGVIVDLRTGKKSVVPSSERMLGFWLNQESLIAPSKNGTNFLTFHLKTDKWTPVGGSNFSRIGADWMISPDSRYMYFTTPDVEPKVMRLRFADRRTETITSLKDLHRVVNFEGTQINVAPDGSPIFTRDTGYQEIFALNVR